jgi:hypothetical protein
VITKQIYCDETKQLSQELIQKSKKVYQILKINLRNYLEDILLFFRHDARYKLINPLFQVIDKIMRQFR